MTASEYILNYLWIRKKIGFGIKKFRCITERKSEQESLTFLIWNKHIKYSSVMLFVILNIVWYGLQFVKLSGYIVDKGIQDGAQDGCRI